MFGLISKRKHDEVVAEISANYKEAREGWRAAMRDCNDQIDQKLKERAKFNKELAAVKYHAEQKERTANRKTREINKYKATVKDLLEQIDGLKFSIDNKNNWYDLMVRVAAQDEAKAKRRIKCLIEQVRYRTQLITKLRQGINIPNEVQKERDKNIKLLQKIAELRSEAHQVKRQLELAQGYIKKHIKA